MEIYFLVYLMIASTVCTVVPDTSPAPRTDDNTLADTSEEPPEGYYAFVESPNATPPRVRPPPYMEVTSECPSVGDTRPHVSAHNLCGDLNRGVIPRNPMGQNVTGRPYPFEVIRNQTLRFLSRTLPVLRADDTLPKVAHLPTRPNQDAEYEQLQDNRLERRGRALPLDSEIPSEELPVEHRSADAGDGGDTPRESRKFCDNDGVFCTLYRAINGEGSSGSAERREDPGTPHPAHPANTPPRYEGPPTPCPARVEYATPVFARNYQGVWRYVVQIPYEGYFTQTVEVTRCMQSRCHYLAGGCLSSPRWVSLLVAELHYPQPRPHSQPQPSPADFQDYQQYLQKRAGAVEGGGDTEKPHCDGHDKLGCYQVRLYYDWFLVPGSCKCWRPDYFERYVRRRQNEL